MSKQFWIIWVSRFCRNFLVSQDQQTSCGNTSVFQKTSGTGKFMDKRGMGFTIFRRIFFHITENLPRGNLRCFRKLPIWKKLMDKREAGGVSQFSGEKFLFHTAKNIRRRTFVFQKISGMEKWPGYEEGFQVFPLEILCLTLPKKNLWGPFDVCHGNHWNDISDKCHWNHKKIWRDRDSNQEPLIESPVFLDPLLTLISEKKVGNFGPKKRRKTKRLARTVLFFTQIQKNWWTVAKGKKRRYCFEISFQRFLTNINSTTELYNLSKRFSFKIFCLTLPKIFVD